MADAFTTFRRIRARMTGCTDADGLVRGHLAIGGEDPELRQDVEELRETGVIMELRKGGHLVQGLEAGDAEYEVVVDRGHLPGYHESYDSLIESAPFTEPAAYHVWEESAVRSEGYKHAVSFLQLLKGKGIPWTAYNFFVVEGLAIEFPMAYAAKDTETLSAVQAEVARFLDAIAHPDADVRWLLFRKAIVRRFADTHVEGRLGALLSNLKSVLDRAMEDYALYLDRYSFEDLLKSFEAKRLEFIGNLNQVLGNVQTALIAVPIGFFLLVEKLDPTAGWGFTNVVLLLGGLCFFALVFALTLNQRKTLDAIEQAFTDFEQDQAGKKTVKQERLERTMKLTKAHHSRVKRLLVAVQVILVVFAVLLGAGFVLLTMGDAREWPCVLRLILRLGVELPGCWP